HSFRQPRHCPLRKRELDLGGRQQTGRPSEGPELRASMCERIDLISARPVVDIPNEPVRPLLQWQSIGTIRSRPDPRTCIQLLWTGPPELQQVVRTSLEPTI